MSETHELLKQVWNRELSADEAYDEITDKYDTASDKVHELTALLDTSRSSLAERDAEIEQLRVQLVGCGVAAMCNTRESMQQQLVEKGSYGYSASYQDVIDAVNREITLRDQLAASQQECEELRVSEDYYREFINDLRQECERLKEGAVTVSYKHNTDAQMLHDAARKQAARDIERYLLGVFWYIPPKENEPMVYRDQVIEHIRRKFGLEG